MPPEQGLIMLGGVYVGAIYGGSIPAILLNIPGTAASLVTAMEGNLMAKQGRSELALNLSATSSGMGGLFSAVALLFLTPLLAKVALSFGPSEYVALIVFSLLIIVFVLPTPAFGNFTGVLIGLMLSLIGLDPFDGSPRFLFGAYQLASGLPLLPDADRAVRAAADPADGLAGGIAGRAARPDCGTQPMRAGGRPSRCWRCTGPRCCGRP